MSKLILQPAILPIAEAGAMEYDGKAQYFTPQGTQRGVIPGMQYFRLNSDVAGANATGEQSMFGVGVTLSANTTYTFEFMFHLQKLAGTTAHTISLGFGGTATVDNILWCGTGLYSTGLLPQYETAMDGLFSNTTSFTVSSGSLTSTQTMLFFRGTGTVSVGSTGTLIPQYSLSAAPGGAYSTSAGSYFSIYPVGAAGNNTSIGTWA